MHALTGVHVRCCVQVNPSEPKVATAKCCYCARSVGENVRVRCAECPDDVDLCIECFSVGVTIGAHQPWHSYQILDSFAFPFLSFDWTAEEELALLEALETYGPTNWTAVADHVGTKTKTQCHNHFMQHYVNSPTAPMPRLEHVIGKDGVVVLSDDAAGPEAVQMASMPPPVPVAGNGSAAAQALATGLAEEIARQSALASFSRPQDPRVEGNVVEVTGFNAKRKEFETEYDNEAELPLADLDFRRDDTPEERALKLRMVEVYNTRLDERLRRKQFILDRGLLNIKRLQNQERRRAPEERELAARCRVLARFHTGAEHDVLLDGLAIEARLRSRIEELKEWRRAGITQMAEGEVYETEKRRRAVERARLKALEHATHAQAAATAAVVVKPGNSRAMRLLGRGAEPVLVPPLVGGSVPRALAQLATDAKPALAGGAIVPAASLTGGGGRRPRGALLDLYGLPGVDLLSSKERELCASTHMLPVYFLVCKETLLRAARSADGPFRKADAKALFQGDTSWQRVYDLLVSAGHLQAAS